MPFLERSPYATVRIEIAYDSGFLTAEDDRTWTAVTTDVDAAVGATITYGRSDELEQPPPNTLALTINNDDGDYTPGTAAPASIKKGLPIRFTVIYGGVDFIRFMGYIDSCSVVWPDGGEKMSQLSVTAASRRARLGQTAPLTSAIRAAYLATGPNAYWPMDEDAEFTDIGGQQIFRDITNDAAVRRQNQILGSFATTDALIPVVRDGTVGPVDEESLVRLPLTTDAGTVSLFAHYVGGGGVTSVNSAGAMTFETVARIIPRDGEVVVTVMDLLMPNLGSEFFMAAAGTDPNTFIAASMYVQDPVTGAITEDHTTFDVTGYNPALFAIATDGELHHWAVTLNGTAAIFYFDGAAVGTMTMSAPITRKYTAVALGSDTYNANVWVGHAAVTDRALTAAEILAHAAAATSASETIEERVVRVAGRIGVPAAEIDVESSIAALVGPQPEAGQSASGVLDDLATSTGGVLYDTRAGHLAMQARNHRYNAASTFTLSAAAQQIEPDLTVVDDHRYTKNVIEYSRSGSDATPSKITDETSRAAFGDFNPGAYTVISASDTEVEAFAQNLLARYADPSPRVSQITVDVMDLPTEDLRGGVLNADIGTRFELASLPLQIPSDPTFVFFEGATETVSMSGHTLQINTTPADIGQNVFILDDPAYGVLDSNVLAY